MLSETRRSRRVARASRWERGVVRMQARGIANAKASAAPSTRYLGGNPTGRGRLWCARFMNMVLERAGHRGTGSDMARSFAGYGQRVSGPQVGAIAVMGRGRGGGHVGVVSGIDASGNPIVVSGNNGNRVRETPVSRGRIYAYVMPN
ncbi:MAG: TIGR02594 family protein [Bradyrhizobium sp.]|uniref:TIGR02594 family protein n=1 Tax=Bradyrhizobium sp. TaxID=376 RepID=UPI0027319E5A|nr:TIGR02594 family protein [Bradyrhizobium sp.]MDP1866741.1 TIGR02594 family protein [Bradyrhizobium sp.]